MSHESRHVVEIVIYFIDNLQHVRQILKITNIYFYAKAITKHVKKKEKKLALETFSQNI